MQGIILAEYIIMNCYSFPLLFSFINCIWEACIMSITNPLFASRSVGLLLVMVSVHDLFPPYLERDSRHLAMACQVPSICPPEPLYLLIQRRIWSRHRYELPCSLASGWVWPIGGPSQEATCWMTEWGVGTLNLSAPLTFCWDFMMTQNI